MVAKGTVKTFYVSFLWRTFVLCCHGNSSFEIYCITIYSIKINFKILIFGGIYLFVFTHVKLSICPSGVNKHLFKVLTGGI